MRQDLYNDLDIICNGMRKALTTCEEKNMYVQEVEEVEHNILDTSAQLKP